MNKVKLMIFDLDGTLIDSIADLAASVNHTLAHLCLPTLPTERIKGFIGDGFTTLLTRCLGTENLDKLDEALIAINAYYRDHLRDHTVLYPGIEDVLDHFSQIPKTIVTQKTVDFTLEIIESLGIAAHFDIVLGIDSTPYKKPDPRLVARIMEK